VRVVRVCLRAVAHARRLDAPASGGDDDERERHGFEAPAALRAVSVAV